jgi:hypothetical protein
MDPLTPTAKQAEAALASRNYQLAIEHYEAIESSGAHSAPDSQNRGLAYAGRGNPGDLGQALAAFKQAGAQAAEEGNVAVTKDSARAEQVVTAELLKRDARGLSTATASTLTYFDAPVIQGVLLGVGTVLMLSALVLTLRKAPRFVSAAACIVAAWCALGLRWKAHSESETTALAVVTVKSANLTLGPELGETESANAQALETLGEGSTVRVLSRKAGACEVQTASKTGYMLLKQVRIVPR